MCAYIFACMHACVHVCMPTVYPICLPIYLSVYLSVYLFVQLTISTCLSTYLQIYLSIHLSICLYTSDIFCCHVCRLTTMPDIAGVGGRDLRVFLLCLGRRNGVAAAGIQHEHARTRTEVLLRNHDELCQCISHGLELFSTTALQVTVIMVGLPVPVRERERERERKKKTETETETETEGGWEGGRERGRRERVHLPLKPGERQNGTAWVVVPI